MSEVFHPINLATAQFNSPSKSRLPPIDDDADDSFSFKLKQVCPSSSQEACLKQAVSAPTVYDHFADFDTFIKE